MFKYFSRHSIDRSYVGIWFVLNSGVIYFRNCHFESLRSERARDIVFTLYTLYHGNNVRSTPQHTFFTFPNC